MEILRRHGSGPTIFCGDFNARHKLWDKRQNNRGSALLRWCQSLRYIIKSPQEPTFHAPSRSSCIDFFISKRVQCSNARVLNGPWDGCSDHLPVLCFSNLTTPKMQKRSTVPLHQRSSQSYIDKARTHYSKYLPGLIDKLEAVTTKKEIDIIYNEICATLKEQWQKHAIREEGGLPAIGTWSLTS